MTFNKSIMFSICDFIKLVVIAVLLVIIDHKNHIILFLKTNFGILTNQSKFTNKYILRAFRMGFSSSMNIICIINQITLTRKAHNNSFKVQYINKLITSFLLARQFLYLQNANTTIANTKYVFKTAVLHSRVQTIMF